jgi:hypothetical protein
VDGTRFSFQQIPQPVHVVAHLKKRRNHSSCVALAKNNYSKLYIYGGSYQPDLNGRSDDEVPFYVYDEKGVLIMNFCLFT